MNENHKFELGAHGCAVCGRKRSHLIHRERKPRLRAVGEIVGRYVVGSKGEFRRIIAG